MHVRWIGHTENWCNLELSIFLPVDQLFWGRWIGIARFSLSKTKTIPLRATIARGILVGEEGAKNSLFSIESSCVIHWILWITEVVVLVTSLMACQILSYGPTNPRIFSCTSAPGVDLPNPTTTSLGGHTLLDQLWRERHERPFQEKRASYCMSHELAHCNTNSHGILPPFQSWRVMYDRSPLGSPSVTREIFQKEPSLIFRYLCIGNTRYWKYSLHVIGHEKNWNIFVKVRKTVAVCTRVQRLNIPHLSKGRISLRRSVKLLPGMDTYSGHLSGHSGVVHLHIFSVSGKYVRRTEKMVNGSHAIRSLAWLIDMIKGDMQSKGVGFDSKACSRFIIPFPAGFNGMWRALPRYGRIDAREIVVVERRNGIHDMIVVDAFVWKVYLFSRVVWLQWLSI